MSCGAGNGEHEFQLYVPWPNSEVSSEVALMAWLQCLRNQPWRLQQAVLSLALKPLAHLTVCTADSNAQDPRRASHVAHLLAVLLSVPAEGAVGWCMGRAAGSAAGVQG
jgi:hypothetical protein